MKKLQPRFLHFIFLCLVGISLFNSCKKSEEPVSRFTWTFKNTVYVPNQYSVTISSLGPYLIVGGMGTNSATTTSRLSFSLTSFGVGTYTFASGSGNSIWYVDEAGNDLDGSACRLDITANDGQFLSGSFSGTFINISGVSNPVTGSFTNLTIEQ